MLAAIQYIIQRCQVLSGLHDICVEVLVYSIMAFDVGLNGICLANKGFECY